MDCVTVHVIEKDIAHSGFKVLITRASGIIPSVFTQTESRFLVVATQEGGQLVRIGHIWNTSCLGLWNKTMGSVADGNLEASSGFGRLVRYSM